MNHGQGKWRLKGRGRRYGLSAPYIYETGWIEHGVTFDDLCNRFNTPETEMLTHARWEFDGEQMVRTR